MTDQTFQNIQIEHCRHLRVTVADEQSRNFISQFLIKFKNDLQMFIISSEISKEGVHHLHGHLEWKKIPKRQTLSDWFKKQQLSGKYYHQQLDKPPINNMLYCVKDLKILEHNITAAQLSELETRTIEINEDKKKSTRQKLLELFKKELVEDHTIILTRPREVREKQINDLVTAEYVLQFIHNTYTRVWDKPPHLSSMKQTCLYIMQKVTDDPTMPVGYGDVICRFYSKFMGFI